MDTGIRGSAGSGIPVWLLSRYEHPYKAGASSPYVPARSLTRRASHGSEKIMPSLASQTLTRSNQRLLDDDNRNWCTLA